MKATIRKGQPSPAPPDRIDIDRYPGSDNDWWSLTITEARDLRDELTRVLREYEESS